MASEKNFAPRRRRPFIPPPTPRPAIGVSRRAASGRFRRDTGMRPAMVEAVSGSHFLVVVLVAVERAPWLRRFLLDERDLKPRREGSRKDPGRRPRPAPSTTSPPTTARAGRRELPCRKRSPSRRDASRPRSLPDRLPSRMTRPVWRWRVPPRVPDRARRAARPSRHRRNRPRIRPPNRRRGRRRGRQSMTVHGIASPPRPRCRSAPDETTP